MYKEYVGIEISDKRLLKSIFPAAHTGLFK